ncbi:MAG TPA: sigma factor [Streptosporangiaceae bacterium]|nr:sigma factor [Streptosporangiaceae bacterium]
MPSGRGGLDVSPEVTPDLGTGDVYERLRSLMFSIAYRMLGSVSEAEDIVQEAFLRYHRAQAGPAGIESPKAFLSAVTTRLCIDELRSARARRETYQGEWLPEPLLTGGALAGRGSGAVLSGQAFGAVLSGQAFGDPGGQLINVFALDIAGGQVRAIRSVINPDKLRHLGPLADLQRLRAQLRAGGGPGTGGQSA